MNFTTVLVGIDRTEHVQFGFEVYGEVELSRTITRKRFVGLASNFGY